MSMNGDTFHSTLKMRDPEDPKFFVELLFPKWKSLTLEDQTYPMLLDPTSVEPTPIAQLEVDGFWKVVYECTRWLGNFKIMWPDHSRALIVEVSPLKISLKGESTFTYEVPEG